MSNNSVLNTLKIIYPAELARQLKVTHRAVARCQEKKYFPSDWFQRITILTNNEVTYEDLYADLYKFKYGIVPEVLINDIHKYASECRKCRQLVGKSRQKAMS